MSRRKSLHKDNEPISSVVYQANSSEEEIVEIETVPCSICGKKFSKDRIERHESICAANQAKAAEKTRLSSGPGTPSRRLSKPFDQQKNIGSAKVNKIIPQLQLTDSSKSKPLFFSTETETPPAPKQPPFLLKPTEALTFMSRAADGNGQLDKMPRPAPPLPVAPAPQSVQDKTGPSPGKKLVRFELPSSSITPTTTPVRTTTSARSTPVSSPGDRMKQYLKLVPCQYCGRTFNPDRIQQHEAICKEHSYPQDDAFKRAERESERRRLLAESDARLSKQKARMSAHGAGGAARTDDGATKEKEKEEEKKGKSEEAGEAEKAGEKEQKEEKKEEKRDEQGKTEMPLPDPHPISATAALSPPKQAIQNTQTPLPISSFPPPYSLPSSSSPSSSFSPLSSSLSPSSSLPSQLTNPSLSSVFPWKKEEEEAMRGSEGGGKATLSGVLLYSTPTRSPSSCLGEVLYSPASTTIHSFLSLIAEQVGVKVGVEQLRKNGFVRIHPGQQGYLVSNFIRSGEDYFAVVMEQTG